MPTTRTLLIFVLLIFYCLPSALAQQTDSDNPAIASDEENAADLLPKIEQKTKGWEWNEGFQPFYKDVDKGDIWLTVSDWQREFLFSYGLGTGLGSNPVGLDRGKLGDQYVCQFRRVGRKVFLVAKNLNYRAISDNPIERRSVSESFAESILWGGEIEAESDGSALFNIGSLLATDLNRVTNQLQNSDQGDFSLDASRCGIYFERCRSFPKNTELESTLTFSSKNPGRLVGQVTPAANHVTLRQHLSFVELPDNNYQPRQHHPRCGSMFVQFSDYASPIDQSLQKRWILRHRLQKKFPDQAESEPVQPIVYYVDPGAPELIRDALIEGASWWDQAFQAAGFKNAFQVKVLPDDADPMDVRYNVIQWVHRSTRGWSYGGSVIDPRTGEIIKGHVTLGSLRVRQDRLIFDSLSPLLANKNENEDQACFAGSGVTEDTTLAKLYRDNDPVEVALARIRQLSAHEVGHTLGFVHNFAASTYDDRASVMDYPAPRIRIDGDRLDLTDAYGVGIGSWDKWTVEYAYRVFDPDNEKASLQQLVKRAIDDNMTFVSDADARPQGAAHPFGNLWDNGTDPVAELQHVMNVRRMALAELSEESLRDDEPLANLQQMFVPVYLHHRYQVDAVAKMIGGVTYGYDTAKTGARMTRVSETQQKQAMQALLQTIDPAALVVPDELWAKLIPQPFSTSRNIELFQGRTSPIFDRESCARIAANLTIGNLLNSERVSRLAMTSEFSEDFGPQQMMVNLIDHVWRQPIEPKALADVSRVLKQCLTDHLLKLAGDQQASLSARGVARFGLDRVQQYLDSQKRTGRPEERHVAETMSDQIQRFLSRPYPETTIPENQSAPPGSPIGNQ